MVIGGSSGSAALTVNHGRYFDTGSSSRSLPCSRSCITAVAVKSLLCEAMRNFVCGVIGQLRRGVGESESGRPDQILIGHDANGHARQVAIQQLPLEPGGEEPLRRLHVGDRWRCVRTMAAAPARERPTPLRRRAAPTASCTPSTSSQGGERRHRSLQCVTDGAGAAPVRPRSRCIICCGATSVDTKFVPRAARESRLTHPCISELRAGELCGIRGCLRDRYGCA